MTDPSKNRFIVLLEKYWWFPFAVLPVGVMFYSIFITDPLPTSVSIAMMVCGILALIGWLTRKKTPGIGEDFSNSLDNDSEHTDRNAVTIDEPDRKEDGKS